MKRILVLGISGMLGNAVYDYFYRSGCTIGTSRKPYDFLNHTPYLFNAYSDNVDELPKADYVINCIGVTNRFIHNDIAKSIHINSVFPHKLAEWCDKNSLRLIHISTDCVFSGKHGYYVEKSVHDETDLYGITKSLGEPENAMVLRTSIIGDEIHNFVNLISWLKNMTGQQVNGFKNHIWNGVTTTCYASICDQIISNNMYKHGLYHVFSDDITKYELLCMVAERYELDVKIAQGYDPQKSINRTLRSDKALVNDLKIPCLSDQL